MLKSFCFHADFFKIELRYDIKRVETVRSSIVSTLSSSQWLWFTMNSGMWVCHTPLMPAFVLYVILVFLSIWIVVLFFGVFFVTVFFVILLCYFVSGLLPVRPRYKYFLSFFVMLFCFMVASRWISLCILYSLIFASFRSGGCLLFSMQALLFHAALFVTLFCAIMLCQYFVSVFLSLFCTDICFVFGALFFHVCFWFMIFRYEFHYFISVVFQSCFEVVLILFRNITPWFWYYFRQLRRL